MDGLPTPGELRTADARGVLRTEWLDARLSFSFGSYQDAARMGFGPLRALNEDRIAPGTGFGMHPHQDMEIFLLPLSGAVEHRDSLGHHALVGPGEIQKMSAGAGIVHSQMNASASEIDHHLQIWITPRRGGTAPHVESLRYAEPGRLPRERLLVSPDGRDGSLRVNQDAWLTSMALAPGEERALWHAPARRMYAHLVQGQAEIRTATWHASMASGDALAVALRTEPWWIVAAAPAWLLLFELDAD